MAKRNATSELNHENWNEEEVPEEAGTFRKAEPDVMQHRIIKSAKRRSGATPENNMSSRSPFATFGGFKATSNTPSTSTFGFKTSNGKADNDGDDKSMEYYSSLKGLNQCVSQWIKSHVDTNPFCILTPIFKDYERYLKDIVEKETKREQKEKDRETTKKSGVTVEQKPEKVLSGSIKSSFGNTSTFNFGCTPSSGNNLTAGFSFGSTQSEENKAEEGEEDQPPKVEFTPVVEEGATYSKRCKVFVKKEASFQERGVGTLYVKPVGEKTQLIVRADTSLGNLLLNTLLSAGMPLQRRGVNNVMLVCVPTPDTKPPPVPVLLRFKTSADADEAMEKLNGYVKNT